MTTNLPRAAALAVLCLLFTGGLLAQDTAAPKPSPLAAALETAAGKLTAGGFAVAEIAGATEKFHAYGHPAPRDGVPTERIIFEIGSVTKIFTGLLLAQTVLEHKAALTDPIGKYLPAELNLDPQLAAITLEQLATHTSGLPRLPTNFTPADRADPYADYSLERLYAFLRGHKPAQAAPQPSTYSNLGVALLGHVLERIHGRSYAQLLHERITGPLGMTDTALTLSEEQLTRFATPHAQGQPVAHWNLSQMAPAGAIRSTLADMTKFARALLDAQSPLAAAWALAREPRVPQSGSQVGLAIMMHPRGSDTVYWHNGATAGFLTYFEVVPAAGRAVVVFLNNSGVVDPREVVNLALAPQSATPAPERIEQPIAAEKLAEYAGVYDIDGRGKFTALVDPQGRLRLRLTGQTFNPVAYGGDDVFFLKAAGAEFHFRRSADGRIAALELHQRGNVIPAKRTDAALPTVVFLTPDKAKEYAGTYELAPGQDFEITARGPWVVAKLGAQPALPVFCDATDHFTYDVVEAALTFERDASGTITALVLHQNGADHRAPRKPAPPARP